jgi:hypothetical protein
MICEFVYIECVTIIENINRWVPLRAGTLGRACNRPCEMTKLTHGGSGNENENGRRKRRENIVKAGESECTRIRGRVTHTTQPSETDDHKTCSTMHTPQVSCAKAVHQMSQCMCLAMQTKVSSRSRNHQACHRKV